MTKKATHIIIRTDDGQIMEGTGETAEKVWEWIRGCETLANVHGSQYPGPYLQTRQAEDHDPPNNKPMEYSVSAGKASEKLDRSKIPHDQLSPYETAVGTIWISKALEQHPDFQRWLNR
jgi:hypothetical protein